MKTVVTGGAGCIGSHLVDRLVARGDEVVVFDNLSTGNKSFLAHHGGRVKFVLGDVVDQRAVEAVMVGVETVFHLAGFQDIAKGKVETDLDLKNNIIGTYHVLEAMRKAGAKAIGFASTSAVFGQPTVVPTPEDHGPPQPISLYGASKLAAEGLISAFVEYFGITAWVYRFANILGERATHGVTYDFIRELLASNSITMKSDGTPWKSYLLAPECVEAMLYVADHCLTGYNLYNLGAGGRTTVNEIAEIATEVTGAVNPTITRGKEHRGWVGDVNQMLLDTTKLNELGWKATQSSTEAVRVAAELIVNELRTARLEPVR